MITLWHVTKCFGSVKPVDDVTLSIPAGAVVVIQGPSGSGKTTLLRLIAGLELPDEGQIGIDGALASSPVGATPPHARGIGMVFQRSALWPHMTVAQNIRFAINGVSNEEAGDRLGALLRETALKDLSSRYPSQLSGGEARRVALARAIASRPTRLLLDEPLTNLDPDLKHHLLGFIQSYAMRIQATVVYVTHDQQEAKKVGGTLIRMDRGRITTERRMTDLGRRAVDEGG